MRFLHKSEYIKTVLVFSDLHLGAGTLVNNRRNCLEDFHFDKELVAFLEHYSTKDYSGQTVELVINGDFIDFLAVPYVPFFDDEFWSETAALEKLKLAISAHQEVIVALSRFLSGKNKSIVYIIGNHDAEFVFESCQNYFINTICPDDKSKIVFCSEEQYSPCDGVIIKHGHTYELAHNFDPKKSIVSTQEGENYFLAPWGSYYVTRVINKFKQERSHINAVKPLRNFLIHGVLFDTLFTLRFIFSTCYYFIMVRFLFLFKGNKRIRDLITYTKREIKLLKNFDSLVEDYFEAHPNIKSLIVGHTHVPEFKIFPEGSIFINTGTWTKMYNLDFSQSQIGARLTYAQIDVKEVGHDINLNEWIGPTELPYREFV